VRIEIAIWAFAHTPRDMDIQRKGRQGTKTYGLRFKGNRL
jgi:hypothetical protein